MNEENKQRGYNAGDPDDVEEARKKHKYISTESHLFLKDIMEFPRTRKWMWDFLDNVCGIHRISHTTNGLQTAFHEGRRDIANRIWSDLAVCCPDKLLLMQKEASERKYEGPNP